MRALIRGKEVCLENAWTKWQRMNMLFLTGKEKDADGNPLPGDGWTLDENYPDPEEPGPEPVQSTPVEEKPAETVPETVTYGGKEYTLEELKKLIG